MAYVSCFLLPNYVCFEGNDHVIKHSSRAIQNFASSSQLFAIIPQVKCGIIAQRCRPKQLAELEYKCGKKIHNQIIHKVCAILRSMAVYFCVHNCAYFLEIESVAKAVRYLCLYLL